MDTRFLTAQQLIFDIFHIPICPLDSYEAIENFSKTHMLHISQQVFNTDVLVELIHELHSKKILEITDRFQIHFFLVLLQETPIAVGPFCSLILTKEDCIKHPSLFASVHIDDLLIYRNQFPVVEMAFALKIVRALVHQSEPSIENIEITHIDSANTKNPLKQSSEKPLRKNYAGLIQERYQLEQRFMHNIEHGNSHAAILNLRNMQQDVAFLKTIGTTLENERIGAAIVRTMTRIAALKAGLPAATIDVLSKENTIKVFQSASVDDIYQEKEKLVLRFCREIRIHQSKNYSNLVSSAMHYIEYYYSQNITVSQIADELSVSVNHLISQFRTETGLTPGKYILTTRLKQAVRLLSNTDLSIQNVSTMVGILDTNYFIKLFKQEYSMTPLQYRKYQRL
ncbi:MAG: helix-turn-helix transcriptional regulator [Lachnospirales bacterium]